MRVGRVVPAEDLNRLRDANVVVRSIKGEIQNCPNPAGASNRDIAQALFITVKTVEMHLGHTYRKLGISSRNELAAHLETATS